MTGLIMFLALLFGGIALWAGVRLVKRNHRRAKAPRLRIIAPSPIDPRAVMMMRARESDSLRPSQRAL